MLISTDKQVAVMDINASTEYEQTQAYYSALVQECKAEESNLDAINAEREHTFQLKKADAYQSLGSGHKTKIVMSGANGENLIRKIFELWSNHLNSRKVLKHEISNKVKFIGYI